ncbi:EGF-like repeat and discoidin I-like domain-containing protein 3 [Desmophyllum pertusum]|uniref:EGF-like repeat and discoidin I-like domain-containing protein 3 n=1 Tax=Desmophyllum pertusum TaxID=174260 RepID=A0A9W9ZL43_9CNID|nr:EGF-like repeat and discoidin I-like domain-containing protein 3 [Desmophyllum pertusum]
MKCIRPVPFDVHPNHFKASTSLEGFSAQGGLITDDVEAAWCAAEKNAEQWIEVDLQLETDVLAVALQGLYKHSWVETFYVQYSTDGNTWYCYGSDNGHKVIFNYS